MGAIDKVVVIDQGGEGQSGVQKFLGNVPATLLGLVEVGKNVGVDIAPMLAKAGIEVPGMETDVTPKSDGDGGPKAGESNDATVDPTHVDEGTDGADTGPEKTDGTPA
jgi:hypothetical protein